MDNVKGYDRREKKQADEAIIPVTIKDVTCDQQKAVLLRVWQESVDGQNQRKEHPENETVKQHKDSGVAESVVGLIYFRE
jgi:hypothetical protein